MNYFTPKMGSAFLILSFSSLVSCSVYYTTQEVEKNLKSTVDMATANVSHLQTQLFTLQSRYTEIPCDKKPQHLVKADQMLVQLDGQMNKVVQLQDTLKQEYKAFVRDNKGKEKIQSGTAEWTKLKQTKKTMKNGLKNLEEEGELTIQLAMAFNQYVIQSVVPTLTVCDIDARTVQFSAALTKLSKDQAEAQKQLNTYEAQIDEVVERFRTSQPQKCDRLYLHLDTIAANVAKITPVKQNVQKAIDTFKGQTKGIKKLYSCQSQWAYVENVQEALEQQQKEISEIEKNITRQHSRLQEILLSLGS